MIFATSSRLSTPAAAPWDKRLGQRWASLLRPHLALDGTQVVEIGPGYATKIGHGLVELGYVGHLLLVDSHNTVRLAALENHRRLLPDARVTSAPSISHVVPGARYIVANHVFDDLVLSANLPQRDSHRFFEEMRPGTSCSSEFRRTWRGMLGISRALDATVTRVVADLSALIRRCQPELVVLNQYPSWSHADAGLVALHDVGLAVLRRLAKDLACCRHVCVEEDDDGMWWLVSPAGPVVGTEGRATRGRERREVVFHHHAVRREAGCRRHGDQLRPGL